MNGLRLFFVGILVLGGLVFWFVAGVRAGSPGARWLELYHRFEVGEDGVPHWLEAARDSDLYGDTKPGHEPFSAQSVDRVPNPVAMPTRLWQEVGKQDLSNANLQDG